MVLERCPLISIAFGLGVVLVGGLLRSDALTLDACDVVPSVPRAHAAWALRVTLTNALSEPATGRLVVEVDDPAQGALLDFETDLLTVGGDPWRRVVWLPPWEREAPSSSGVLVAARQLRVRWRGADGEDKLLLEQALQAPGEGTYHHYFLAGPAKRGVTTPLDGFLPYLTLTCFLRTPPYLTLDTSEHMIRLRPSAFPKSPIAYTAFDMVVLDGPTFAALDAAQLDALLAWLRAGGRVLVRPFAQPLTDAHMDFLRALEARSEGPSLLDRDPVSRQLRRYDRPYSRHVVGLGRALILSEIPDLGEAESAVSWQRAGLFLYRLPLGGDRLGYRHLEVEPAVDDRQWRQWLEQHVAYGVMEPLPFWWLLGGVLLYVALIVPIDRRVFRRLGKRNLTWIAFPLTTLFFSWGLMMLTDWHHGRYAVHQRVHIVDLGNDGRVLRQSTFHFTQRGRDTETALPLRHTMSTLLPGLTAERLEGRLEHRYEGNFPQVYQHHLREAQWRPLRRRHFHIPMPGKDTLPHPEVLKVLAEGSSAGGRYEKGMSMRRLREREVAALCVPPQKSPSNRVFRPQEIAPKGGQHLHDLYLVDPRSDPRPLPAMVEVVVGDDLYYYRQFGGMNPAE